MCQLYLRKVVGQVIKVTCQYTLTYANFFAITS